MYSVVKSPYLLRIIRTAFLETYKSAQDSKDPGQAALTTRDSEPRWMEVSGPQIDPLANSEVAT